MPVAPPGSAHLGIEASRRLRPFEAELERLETIRGSRRRGAEVIAAKIGLDTDVFPTAGHLASWAGMCPGNHASAGKRKSAKTRQDVYHDLSPAQLDADLRARATKRARDQLETLGFDVSPTPRTPRCMTRHFHI